MPTNLPPNYYSIDKRYKSATTDAEKIACLEEMMSIIPKHKGTDKLRAGIRKRLSKVKNAAQSKKSSGKKDSSYIIEKEGAGQVAVIGAPNVGKSKLVDLLTNSKPEVSAAPFTTWKPTPGMMNYKDINIQLIDTPPLNRDYMESGLFDLIRRSDMVLCLVDIQSDAIEQLNSSIAILKDHKIVPKRLQNLYEEHRNIRFLPIIIGLNKFEDDNYRENTEIFKAFLDDQEWPIIEFSAENSNNINALKEMIFNRLEIIRIYAKSPGKPVDKTAPFVLKKNSNVGDFATKVHKDIEKNMKTARVWGEGVFDGQMVQKDHILYDEDIVEVNS
jgi:uncharacterized protein